MPAVSSVSARVVLDQAILIGVACCFPAFELFQVDLRLSLSGRNPNYIYDDGVSNGKAYSIVSALYSLVLLFFVRYSCPGWFTILNALNVVERLNFRTDRLLLVNA
jgi:hypothetical protein